jgi:phosphoadenosine phosphosulfate reductase
MPFPLQPDPSIAARLNDAFRDPAPAQRLKLLRREVPGRMVFTTSFGIEDQVLTHLIAASGIDVEFATLDTGRLFPETYKVWAETEKHYGIPIRPYYPEATSVENLIAAQGIDGFYSSVEARKACCGVRKLQPLVRALNGASVWITGLRADQSSHRRDMDFVSFDAERGLIKANPLLDWTRDYIAAFVAAHGVPHNALHAQGFLSIGCAPCTRAIRPGEPERAGRWWWEQGGEAECGLHVDEDGRLVRKKAA